mgnify:CR=1 FL=1
MSSEPISGKHKHDVSLLEVFARSGVYGFPLARAVPVALREVGHHLAVEALPARVLLVCFDPITARAYREALAAPGGADSR